MCAMLMVCLVIQCSEGQVMLLRSVSSLNLAMLFQSRSLHSAGGVEVWPGRLVWVLEACWSVERDSPDLLLCNLTSHWSSAITNYCICL